MASRDFNLEFNSIGIEESVDKIERDEVERRFQKIEVNSGKLLFYGRLQDCKWEDFKKICDLGRGICGEVSKYQHHGLPIATMSRSYLLEENKRIMMDLEMVTRTGACPHIVKCYGYFITQLSVRICMEVMSTCLQKLMEVNLKRSPFPQNIVGKVAVSVLDALSYLKDEHNVIHRDVKPPNILINFNGSIKLCDFGISGFLVESLAHTVQAGCQPYMAPERISPGAFKTNYDVRSDVWSLGMTIVELATGKYPYPEVDGPFEYLTAIIALPSPELKTQDGFALDLSHFITYILNKDVNERPRYPQILKHPYILRSRKEVTDVGSWLEEVMTSDEQMDDGYIRI